MVETNQSENPPIIDGSLKRRAVMFCQDCPKRNSCTELCEEAETYASQDYVLPEHCKQCDDREYCSVEYMESGLCPLCESFDVDEVSTEKTGDFVTKSNEEIIIQLFFMERKRVTQIAKIIGVSHPYVSKVVKKYKEILKKNLQE